MNDLRTAAQQALEAICGAKLCEFNSMSSRHEMVRLMNEAITALRAALAEPVQKPVAHTLTCVCGATWDIGANGSEELVHAPPQRKPLTDDQLDDIAVAARRGNLYDLRIAVERAIWEKNNG